MEIILKEIKKKYDNENYILNCLNYTFEEGLYLIKGRSGVGKTTLLNIISGYSQVSKGEVLLCGINKICYIMQENLLFSNLTVLENLKIMYSGTFDVNLFEMKLHELGLNKEVISSKVSKLSGGQVKKIELLLYTMKKQFDVLLLDEPVSNLDGNSILQFVNYIESLLDTKKIIIIVSHKELNFTVPYKVLEIIDSGWKEE